MAVYTILGSSTLALVKSDETFTSLCKKVQSKGGTTIEATKVIEGSGFADMMLRAMEACRTRAIELGDEFSKKVEKKLNKLATEEIFPIFKIKDALGLS